MARGMTSVSQGFRKRTKVRLPLFCSAKRPSEIERRVVDHFLHDKESPGLADARQRDQLFAMDAVEILHVADANLEEIVEIAGHQMAIQHEFQLRDCSLEGGKTVRCGAVEHHADHD